MSAEDPQFWACEVPPNASVTQRIPSSASLCLTGAGLSPDASGGRSTLWVASAGCKAVLCNLSPKAHAHVRLGQPFSGEVTFSAVGEHTIHLSGFSRGKMPAPAAKAGSKKVEAPAAAKKGETIAAKSKAVSAEKLMGCLLYTSPSPRDRQKSRMPSSA